MISPHFIHVNFRKLFKKIQKLNSEEIHGQATKLWPHFFLQIFEKSEKFVEYGQNSNRYCQLHKNYFPNKPCSLTTATPAHACDIFSLKTTSPLWLSLASILPDVHPAMNSSCPSPLRSYAAKLRAKFFDYTSQTKLQSSI